MFTLSRGGGARPKVGWYPLEEEKEEEKPVFPFTAYAAALTLVVAADNFIAWMHLLWRFPFSAAVFFIYFALGTGPAWAAVIAVGVLEFSDEDLTLLHYSGVMVLLTMVIAFRGPVAPPTFALDHLLRARGRPAEVTSEA